MIDEEEKLSMIWPGEIIVPPEVQKNIDDYMKSQRKVFSDSLKEKEKLEKKIIITEYEFEKLYEDYKEK